MQSADAVPPNACAGFPPARRSVVIPEARARVRAGRGYGRDLRAAAAAPHRGLHRLRAGAAGAGDPGERLIRCALLSMASLHDQKWYPAPCPRLQVVVQNFEKDPDLSGLPAEDVEEITSRLPLDLDIELAGTCIRCGKGPRRSGDAGALGCCVARILKGSRVGVSPHSGPTTPPSAVTKSIGGVAAKNAGATAIRLRTGSRGSSSTLSSICRTRSRSSTPQRPWWMS